MFSGLKKVLIAIGKTAGKAAVLSLPELPALMKSSPSLVVALWRLGAKIAPEVLADALKRLEAAGAADPSTRMVSAGSPHWAPFFAVQAAAGEDWAASEVRRSLEHVSEEHPHAWAGLLSEMEGSCLECLGDSLERRETPMTAYGQADLEASAAYAAALDVQASKPGLTMGRNW